MERADGAAAGISRACTPEEMAAESLRFEEEIQSLMRDGGSPPAPSGAGSFTALLGLPPLQAIEFLHDAPPPWRPRLPQPPWDPPCPAADLPLPSGFSPTFPSDAGLVDRAARFSVFASRPALLNPKPEPAADSESFPIAAAAACRIQKLPGKRKDPDPDRSKAKKGFSSKRSRSSESAMEKPPPSMPPPPPLAGDEKQQLPFIHVRARRGQATDSHSIAERARREKINARMKLLQQIVPGCNKISGTALVLDEIINHVQSLQRQVEFLSMWLAAASPRIDFAGLGASAAAFFAEEDDCGERPAASGGGEGIWATARRDAPPEWATQQQKKQEAFPLRSS